MRRVAEVVVRDIVPATAQGLVKHCATLDALTLVAVHVVALVVPTVRILATFPALFGAVNIVKADVQSTAVLIAGQTVRLPVQLTVPKLAVLLALEIAVQVVRMAVLQDVRQLVARLAPEAVPGVREPAVVLVAGTVRGPAEGLAEAGVRQLVARPVRGAALDVVAPVRVVAVATVTARARVLADPVVLRRVDLPAPVVAAGHAPAAVRLLAVADVKEIVRTDADPLVHTVAAVRVLLSALLQQQHNRRFS